MENKNTAAQNASAPTDTRQPHTNSNDIISTNVEEIKPYEEISRRILRLGDPYFLPTVSMTELYDTVYRQKSPIIDGLLYSGTYLFAGAPKVGKSFLMAQLAYHISSGISVWNYPVNQGSVLYLALEDDFARLQKRLYRMFGADGNESLHLSTHSKQLNSGLDKQIEGFMTEHKDTRLIIIDTLQKVRDIGGEKYSYASDYEVVTKLKRFTDQYPIALILVHHTRKQAADDCFDTISGTNGLLGAADGAFLLQKDRRTDNKATLDIAGRDQQDQRLHLEFDREHCLWQLVKSETELWQEPPDEILIAISGFIADKSEWHGTATELTGILNLSLSPNSLTRRLNINADKLLNDYKIVYESNRSHAGRQIKLYRA